MYVIHVDVLAINEGFFIVVASRCSTGSSFVFESNSLNAVVWMKEPFNTPWNFKNLIRECHINFGRSIQRAVSYIHRTRNKAADILVI